jgi:hypothetical protein
MMPLIKDDPIDTLLESMRGRIMHMGQSYVTELQLQLYVGKRAQNEKLKRIAAQINSEVYAYNLIVSRIDDCFGNGRFDEDNQGTAESSGEA